MSKILYAASTMSHINNFHLDYINALRAEGHTVLTMAKGEGADFDVPFEKKIFSSQNTKCRREIRKILDREHFDVIILNTTLAAFHIRLACRGRGRPRIVNIVHGYLFSENTGVIKRTLFLLCEKILKSKTDSVIVMNEDDLKIATENRLARGEVYHSLGMGARKKPLANIDSPLFEKREDSFVMSFVGELSKRKNQAFLIRALARIRREIDTAELWLIGEGDERENLESLARECGVAESVKLIGSTPHPCDFIAKSDLYVSASAIEGLPFNVLEALAYGVPSLISDIKGQKDIVTHGDSGFLYPFGDEDAFVDSVLRIRRGEWTLDRENIISAYEKFSFDKVFKQTLDTIKKGAEI